MTRARVAPGPMHCDLREFAERNRIASYVANRGNGPSWASLLPGHLAFECGAYRVFGFRSSRPVATERRFRPTQVPRLLAH